MGFDDKNAFSSYLGSCLDTIIQEIREVKLIADKKSYLLSSIKTNNRHDHIKVLMENCDNVKEAILNAEAQKLIKSDDYTKSITHTIGQLKKWSTNLQTHIKDEKKRGWVRIDWVASAKGHVESVISASRNASLLSDSVLAKIKSKLKSI
jgi:predicted transcriptional regulator